MKRALLAFVLIAGCATPAADDTAPIAEEALIPVVDHDHLRDAHSLAWNLEEVGRLPLADLLGGEPGRASDLQFHGALAAVAVNGGSGGFVLLDASDPAQLKPLSRYRSGSEDNWYVKFTSDGRYVLLTANGNAAPAPAATSAMEALRRGVVTQGARGLHVVDIADPGAPRLAGFYPAPVRLINAATWNVDGTEYAAVSVVSDRAIAGAPAPGAAPNDVRILRLDEEPGGIVLRETARWAPPAASGEVLVHDLAVEIHPVTGATLLYAACWDAGAYLLDVTDPARVVEVGRFETDEGQVHTVKPHPGLVDGRHLTLVAPETFGGEASGTYHLLDTTDPARPAPVATWALPGELANDAPLLWSPHEFTLAQGKAYTSNFHGGAWVLDLRDGLRPVAAWADGRAEGGHVRWAVDVETLVWHDGLVHAVDMGGGLVALRETR